MAPAEWGNAGTECRWSSSRIPSPRCVRCQKLVRGARQWAYFGGTACRALCQEWNENTRNVKSALPFGKVKLTMGDLDSARPYSRTKQKGCPARSA
ncbi:hypothetical protein GCM10027569_08370 [Flindersiella endophytica]